MCKDFPAWDKQIYTSENQKKLYPGALSWNTEPVLTQHYRHPHQESSIHRQLGLFVVVFREEIRRKQDFMGAKSALNFLSFFFFIFIFEQEIIHFGLLIKCSSVRVGGKIELFNM